MVCNRVKGENKTIKKENIGRKKEAVNKEGDKGGE